MPTITIPNGVTSIESYTFANCTSLSSVTIPSNVTYIGDSAFYCCAALSSVTIPSNVIYIGTEAFRGCDSLSSVTIPGNVTTISESAFYSCDNLVTVTMKRGVTTIGKAAFQGCISLANLTIPASVTTIGQGAFYGCDSLKNLTIPEGVQTIESSAFYSCDNLTSVEIPYSVTTIGNSAFSNCENLTSLTVLNPDCALPSGKTSLGQVGITTIRGYNGSTAQDYALEYGFSFQSLGDSKFTFIDVPTSVYYYVPVLWAVEKAITAGIDATHFGPSYTCTRGQVVTFLWRAMGSPEPSSTYNPFVDVNSSDYYYKAVLWAVENGITAGMDATHFGPGDSCIRGQIVTFLWRTMSNPEPSSTYNPFVDVNSSDYYYKAVLWAVENGITAGMDAMHFGPSDSCIRGQVVTFLYRDLANS